MIAEIEGRRRSKSFDSPSGEKKKLSLGIRGGTNGCLRFDSSGNADDDN